MVISVCLTVAAVAVFANYQSYDDYDPGIVTYSYTSEYAQYFYHEPSEYNSQYDYYHQWDSYESYESYEYTLGAEESYYNTSSDEYIVPTDGYIGIMPLNPPIYLTTITNLAQLQGLQTLINGIPTTGATAGTPRLVRFNFPGGILATSAHPTIMPTINITGNRHIILDGNAAGVHQRWNRDGTTHDTGRHFNISGGASLELLNVNISRPLGSNPTVMSGGINVTGNNSTLTLNHPNARISNNRTDHAGGGVFVNNGGRLYMHNGSIDGNISFVNYNLVPPAHGDAGGVMIRDGGFFTITGGRIHNNESRVSGAGAFVLQSMFTMTGGYIENNRATGDGGGLVISNSTATMNNGRIRNNTADIRMLNNAPVNGWGGGVLVIGTNSNFTMNDGHIYQNRTYHGGGGVWVGGGNNVTFNMHGGVINDNRYRPTRVGANVPIPQGGGVWINGGSATANLHSGTIRNNQAVQGGGVRASGGAQLNMYGGTIGGPRGCDDNCDDHANPVDCAPNLGNSALNGGGVWLGGGASFYMQGPSPSGGGPPRPRHRRDRRQPCNKHKRCHR